VNWRPISSGCPLCEQQIREFGDLIADVPQALPGIEPSTDLKTRLMAQLEREPQTGEVIELRSSSLSLDRPKGAKPHSWLPWACALAAGLALVISLWNLSNLKQDFPLRGRLNRQNEQIQELQDQLRRKGHNCLLE
jgi:hypothetical protein